jgi:hypothetical protein
VQDVPEIPPALQRPAANTGWPADGLLEIAASVQDGLLEIAASVQDGLLEIAASVQDGLLEIAASVQDGLNTLADGPPAGYQPSKHWTSQIDLGSEIANECTSEGLKSSLHVLCTARAFRPYRCICTS